MIWNNKLLKVIGFSCKIAILCLTGCLILKENLMKPLQLLIKISDVSYHLNHQENLKVISFHRLFFKTVLRLLTKHQLHSKIIWTELSVTSIKKESMLVVNQPSSKLSYSLFVSIIPSFLVEESSVLKVSLLLMSLMKVILINAQTSLPIIWRNSKLSHTKIWNTFSEKLCTVVISPIPGIEEPTLHISKDWSKKILWLTVTLYNHSVPQIQTNMTMRSIKKLSKLNYPKKPHKYLVSIQTQKLVT